MGTRTLIWANRRDRLQVAIAELEDGIASVVLDGVTKTASDLPQLTRDLELASVRAAIEAIEQGAQSYEVLGRRFQKAELAVLYSRADRLEQRAVARSGSGIRVRFGVPLG